MGREGVGRPPNRRWFVRDLGLGGLEVAVLTACSRAGSSGAAAPAVSTGTSGTSATGASGTGTAGTAGTASAAATAAGPDATGPLSWDRVDLGFVSACVPVRGDQAAVVDTGTPGSADQIGAVLEHAGPGWAGVQHGILTHKHGDHAGSVPDVLDRATGATGHDGAADLGEVSDSRPLRPLADRDEVFGLRMVASPGHTAGHLSVFDPGSGLLVAGDAIATTGALTGPNPQFSEDMTACAASVRLLATLASLAAR